MNRHRRKKIGKCLRAWRTLKRFTAEEAAHALGWPLAVYLKAEQGEASLSVGQQIDARRAFTLAAKRL